MVAPRGAGELLAQMGFSRIHEVGVGERVSAGGLRLAVTRAVHTPVPRLNAPPVECVGYVLDGSRKVYFAGDTDLFDEMRDLSAGLDVALLPVWGWWAAAGP